MEAALRQFGTPERALKMLRQFGKGTQNLLHMGEVDLRGQVTLKNATASDFTAATLTGTDATLTNLTGTTATIGTLNPTTVVRASQSYRVGVGARAGATAGWTFPAVNTGIIARLPASQTGSTLVVPAVGLHIGDTITEASFHASCTRTANTYQISTVTLRKLVSAAGGATDSSIGSLTISPSGALSASAIVTGSLTGVSEVVVAGTQYYFLFTATTGANTSIDIDSAEITVTTA